MVISRIRCFDVEKGEYVDLQAIKMHHLHEGLPHTVVIRTRDGKIEEWVLGPKLRLETDL